MYGCESWKKVVLQVVESWKKESCEESWAPKNWCFWTVVLEKTLESPLDCKEIQPVHPKGGQSWVFIGMTDAEAETPNSLVTSCEELTHWKRPWCWEELGAGREGDDRGWDGWMASPTRWTWVWVNSSSWWWTGRPGVLRFMGLRRVGHDLSDWTELNWIISDVDHLFMGPLVTCMSSLEKCQLRSSGHFYFLIWLLESLKLHILLDSATVEQWSLNFF